MLTRVFDWHDPQRRAEAWRHLPEVAAALRMGELVAFPTETVYGLGANALLPDAVRAVFSAKGRPQDNPLIIHLASLAQLPDVAVDVPALAYDLFGAFAPGPLTLVLHKHRSVPDCVSGGLDTVAVRLPAHEVARELIEAAACPVVAPSANLSGRPSPTQAWHVLEDLDGKIPYLLDGGPCAVGLESTVLDLTSEQPLILRPGAVSAEMIRDRLGLSVRTGSDRLSPGEQPRSPGMKYRHYAPRTQVMILPLASDPAERLRMLGDLLGRTSADPIGSAGLFLPQSLTRSHLFKLFLQEQSCFGREIKVRSYDAREGADEAAHELFDMFRSFDRAGVDLIICAEEPADETGAAYMNRLRRAART